MLCTRKKKYKLPLFLIVSSRNVQKSSKSFWDFTKDCFSILLFLCMLKHLFFSQRTLCIHFSSSIHCLITHLTPTSLYNYSLWWCEYRQHNVTLCNATTLHHNEMSLQEKERRKKTNLKRIRVNMYIKVKDDTLVERVFFSLVLL